MTNGRTLIEQYLHRWLTPGEERACDAFCARVQEAMQRFRRDHTALRQAAASRQRIEVR